MDKKDLRIVFMGTPEFAVGSLKALVEGGYNVVAVVTQPDKPVGRHGNTLKAPDVKLYAQEHGLPVVQPVKMKDEDFVETLRQYHADLQVVVAFRMLPEVVWNMPRFGTFNVHAALLPQYRGAAPINWAIINGEKQTGVTTFFLDHDIDTGRIIMRETFDIPEEADVEYVYNGLMDLGAQVCLRTVDLVAALDGNVPSIPQEQLVNDEPLHPAPKIFNDTCRINWAKSSREVCNFVRGLSPWPGAWTMLHTKGKADNGTVLKIYQAAISPKNAPSLPVGSIVNDKNTLCVVTGEGLLEIKQLQLAGKKRMDAKAFINGFKDISNCSLA